MSPYAGGDPLFNHGIDVTVAGILIVKVLVVFVLVLLSVLIYIWFMRKVIADMQNRIGPDQAGPFGVLQTLADGIKLFFKEHSTPTAADRPVYLLAPFVSALAAFLAFAIVPFGGIVRLGTHVTFLQLADPPIGVLWLLAMSGIGVYGVMLAGWSSGSKYPLLGSVRASAQVLSYEAAIGLSIVGVLIHTGTLSTRGIVLQQSWNKWDSFVSQWLWLPAIGAFIIFLIAATAETNHPPFDFSEAEEELAGGYHIEYGGIRFAIFYLAEFMNVITMSAIAVTLFLGGPSGPRLGFLDRGGWVNVWIVPVFWFMLKLWAVLYATVWIRASLPRLRYDLLMDLGWKVLIEAAFLWAMVTGVIVVARDRGWDLWIVTPVAAAAALLVYGFLMLCVPRRDELEEIR
ncbi:MAG TPA: NADH-quinone oxidoreductase subunit H [Acidimicrobiia bacterium]|nr:NADH-quinone oxidoreductase subunit H [Acidimicrobiia bacterium]